MEERKPRPRNGAVMLRCLVFLAVLAVILGIVNVAIVATLAANAKSALEAAPGMIDDYIKANAGPFLDQHIRENVPEVVQGAMLATVMSMGGSGGGGSEHEGETASDELPPEDCGVHDPLLIGAFRRTCADFSICKTQGTDTSCSAFIQDLAYTCNNVKCDSFDDKDKCDRVVTLCANRLQALYNYRARQHMMDELTDLCSILGRCA